MYGVLAAILLVTGALFHLAGMGKPWWWLIGTVLCGLVEIWIQHSVRRSPAFRGQPPEWV